MQLYRFAVSMKGIRGHVEVMGRTPEHARSQVEVAFQGCDITWMPSEGQA